MDPVFVAISLWLQCRDSALRNTAWCPIAWSSNFCGNHLEDLSMWSQLEWRCVLKKQGGEGFHAFSLLLHIRCWRIMSFKECRINSWGPGLSCWHVDWDLRLAVWDSVSLAGGAYSCSLMSYCVTWCSGLLLLTRTLVERTGGVSYHFLKFASERLGLCRVLESSGRQWPLCDYLYFLATLLFVKEFPSFSQQWISTKSLCCAVDFSGVPWRLRISTVFISFTSE